MLKQDLLKAIVTSKIDISLGETQQKLCLLGLALNRALSSSESILQVIVELMTGLNPSSILYKDQESRENAVKASSHLFDQLFSISRSL